MSAYNMSWQPLRPKDCLTYKTEADANGETRKVVTGVNYERAADMILENYHIVYVVEHKSPYIYMDGQYRNHGHEFLNRYLVDSFRGITTFSGQSVMSMKCREQILSQLYARRGDSLRNIDNQTRYFNLDNGLLDLETLDISAHTPDIVMFNKSPVIYDSRAECPHFEEYLDNVLPKKYHETLEEIIGYTLYPGYPAEKAFMFYGPRRTGKSTMLRTIQKILGENNCSHVSLHDLISDKFAGHSLFGKLANISGDLPAVVLGDPGIFKNATGEDTIEVQEKGKTRYNLHNKAKMIFSTNALPALKYDDPAYYGRWIILPFTYSFYGREDYKIEQRMQTPEELSGILNIGLAGLARLRSNHWRFSYTDDAEKVYLKASKPVLAFLDENFELSDSGHISKDEFIKLYNVWAEKNKLPMASSKKAVGLLMQDQTMKPVTTAFPSISGKQVESWSGIQQKSDEEKKQNA